MKTNLENVVGAKIRPILGELDDSIIDLEKISDDITSRVLDHPLCVNWINLNLPYKQAKRLFKRDFLISLLKRNCGNVSEAARVAEVDRRSIYRYVEEDFFRDLRVHPPKRDDSRTAEIYVLLEEVLNGKLESSADVGTILGSLAHQIASQLPDERISLKQAEEAFEKTFIKGVLIQNNGDVARTAESMGLRYETLHRKIKSLGLES